MQTLTYASGTPAPLLALSYTYDDASNIDRKTKDGVLYDYGYDNLYQLTGVTIPSATSQNESFTYDAVGNRLSSIDKPNWNYDENNRLTGYNGVSFGYDNNGNTISKADASGTTSYDYSIDNRLLAVTTSTISASYQYDPMGRRIRKTVNGTTTNYLWDENLLLAELDNSGNILKTYLHNPNNNEPISIAEGTDTYWYLNDHLMTPQKIVDSLGAVVWSAGYKAFGEVTIDPLSTITNNLRFPGQNFDQETGLYYNLNRYYDFSVGRYIRNDLFNLATKDFLVFNLLLANPQLQYPYSYAINNPINITDQTGSSVWSGVKTGLEIMFHVLFDVTVVDVCEPNPCEDYLLARNKAMDDFGKCLEKHKIGGIDGCRTVFQKTMQSLRFQHPGCGGEYPLP